MASSVVIIRGSPGELIFMVHACALFICQPGIFLSLPADTEEERRQAMP